MMQHARQPVREPVAHFLVGPTAVGKSAVAHFIASQERRPVLSADSMLVYRAMDIGTAKPTRAERDCVRYHGIDLVPPSEIYSVGSYARYAGDVLRRTPDDEPAIVVGGSGLYIKALTDGLAELPETAPERRAHWLKRADTEGISALLDELRARAPLFYDALDDPENVRRVIRAHEMVDAGLKAPPAGWRADRAYAPLAGLRMAPDALSRRIAERVQAMYAGGLVDEARSLRDAYPQLSLTAAHAIGYAEVFAYLEGRYTRGEAIERTLVRTRRLAKRQRTWFRNQARVEWIDVLPGTPVEQTAERVMEHWKRHGPTQIGS
jgi:tRNA dimethylallyltransferase